MENEAPTNQSETTKPDASSCPEASSCPDASGHTETPGHTEVQGNAEALGSAEAPSCHDASSHADAPGHAEKTFPFLTEARIAARLEHLSTLEEEAEKKDNHDLYALKEAIMFVGFSSKTAQAWLCQSLRSIIDKLIGQRKTGIHGPHAKYALPPSAYPGAFSS